MLVAMWRSIVAACSTRYARALVQCLRSRATAPSGLTPAPPSLASRKPSMPIRRSCLSGKQAAAEASRESNKRRDGMNATEDSICDAPDERDDFSDWEQSEGEAAFGETLVVDVEGFEG